MSLLKCCDICGASYPEEREDGMALAVVPTKITRLPYLKGGHPTFADTCPECLRQYKKFLKWRKKGWDIEKAKLWC